MKAPRDHCRQLGRMQLVLCGWATHSLARSGCTVSDPAFSCPMASFYTPDLSEVLCETTDIRHVFTRDAVQRTDALGLLMA
jgi:hypothetical protein